MQMLHETISNIWNCITTEVLNIGTRGACLTCKITKVCVAITVGRDIETEIDVLTVIIVGWIGRSSRTKKFAPTVSFAARGKQEVAHGPRANKARWVKATGAAPMAEASRGRGIMCEVVSDDFQLFIVCVRNFFFFCVSYCTLLAYSYTSLNRECHLVSS